MTADDKPRRILDAAVRVFAAHGYDASRVSDVAREAGVAYGLVYHYYESKEAVLEAVFREAWGRLLAAVALAEETGDDASEQLELVVKIVLRAWRDARSQCAELRHELPCGDRRPDRDSGHVVFRLAIRPAGQTSASTSSAA